MLPLARSDCALLSAEQVCLGTIRHEVVYPPSKHSPVEALYIRATLSILPVTKCRPSGDHARSYISDPVLDLHIVFTRQCSRSSDVSSPKVVCRAGLSEGAHSSTLPSSPAEARSSPRKADQPILNANKAN